MVKCSQLWGRRGRKPKRIFVKRFLSNSEWHRLQASVNGINQHNRSVIAAAQQREALHMRSKELVKHWSNTIAVSSTALYASVKCERFSWKPTIYAKSNAEALSFVYYQNIFKDKSKLLLVYHWVFN